MATVASLIAGLGVKFGHTLEWDISHKLKISLFEVSFGATENYATGGIAVSFPGISEVIGACYVGGDLRDYHVIYNTATGKVQVFGQEPTNTTTGVIAFSELANNSTVINSKKVRFLVVGT
jgi:hypothetical protein